MKVEFSDGLVIYNVASIYCKENSVWIATKDAKLYRFPRVELVAIYSE